MKQAQNPSVAENHLGGVAVQQNGIPAVLPNRSYTQSISMIPRGVAAVRENGTPASRSGSARRYICQHIFVGRHTCPPKPWRRRGMAATDWKKAPMNIGAYRRNFRPGQAWALIALVFLLAAPLAWGATNTWLPTGGTNDWFVETNWSSGTWPTNGDDVIITNTIASNNFGVLLTNATAPLSSILLSNTCMLVFSNWDTSLTATNVSILNNSALTLPGPFANTVMSNRVYVVCSNLTVASSGRIDANGRGYRGALAGTLNGNGPGAGLGTVSGYGSGAGHGGRGGNSSANVGGSVYDSVTNPSFAGSGGGAGSGPNFTYSGHGGGAIRIQASGAVTVNGLILANGVPGSNAINAGGSGGSIWIDCSTFGGAGGGLRAEGGAGNTDGDGAGGRIAIYYNPAAQPTGAVGVQFSARTQVASTRPADIGTLYFPDARILTNGLSTNAFAGQIYGFSSWATDALTVSNTPVRFVEDGFQLTVTNNLVVRGSAGRLELGGKKTWTTWPWLQISSTVTGPVLDVGGNVLLTNGGVLVVYAGLTNAGGGTNTTVGAEVRVVGDITIATNSWLIPVSHPTNGASVYVTASNVTVATPGAGVDARSNGFAGGSTSANGYGPGFGYAAAYASGGGYGGRGGRSLSTASRGASYGSSNAPVRPGSGGGAGSAAARDGARGGGLIWINATDTITVNGSLLADGEAVVNGYGGAGSGGGIYLRCLTFAGGNNGLLRANGGAGGGNQGGGGGGRIAVWRRVDRHSYQGSYSVTNGASYTTDAEVGTIFFGVVPPPGTIFTIH